MRAILTYHSIDSSGSPVSIDPPSFRRHVAWLAAAPVEVLPLAELVAEPEGDDAVAVTFDDALTNFTAQAWPVLKDSGLPATLFVPTDHVGGRNDWGDPSGRPAPGIPSLTLLDWPVLGQLAEEGLILGSHGRCHLDLRRLTDSALEDELQGSKEVLARETGVRAESLAYPYGAVDDRVAAIARRIYRLACTTELKPLAADDPHHWLPRLDAFYLRRSGALEAWGSRRFLRRLALRRLGRRVRARLAGAPTADRDRDGDSR